MTEKTDLLKRREELKHTLREENTKTLVDVILEGVSRPFQKVIGKNRTVIAFYGTLIVFLLTMLMGMIVIALLSESASLQQFIQRYRIWLIVIGLFSATGSMTLANIFIHRMITILRESVLDTVETIDTLDDIEQWVASVCDKKLASAAAMLGIPVGYYLVLNLSAISSSLYGVGLTVLVILFSMQSSIFFGFSIAILFLTVRLRNYQLELFPSDPSSSQVISHLSSFMSNFVYLFAVYGALTTFGIITTGLWSSFNLTLPLFWILIVLIFTITQYSLAQIIQRSKWKTLNELQAQIEKIQNEQLVPEKEARETLVWLLDYHARVKATQNSALNLGVGLNLLNSLLLPVLAFVLGNLDKIIALLP